VEETFVKKKKASIKNQTNKSIITRTFSI